jgi:YesN/AraC family two-component response regulator
MSAVPSSVPQILVLDDELSMREALAMALAGSYVVHTAATGNEACAILQDHPVAGIVLDAILGDEHGLDLVERFRTLSHAPILLLTGHGTEELAIRALRAQVSEYLKKPVNLHELHAAVTRLLSGGRVLPDPMVHVHLHLAEDPDRQFTAGGLARHVGLSERQFRRRFRAVYGTTPARYLSDLRLEQAAELLRTTRLGIKQIAVEVGCPNVAWFAKLFKRAYGVPPSDFRTRHRQPGARGPAGGHPSAP